MDKKERDDPEFKLDSINKLVAEYEQRKYLVLPVWRIREILSEKRHNIILK